MQLAVRSNVRAESQESKPSESADAVNDQHADKLEHESRASRVHRRVRLVSPAQLQWNPAKRAPHRRKQQERRAEQPEQRSARGDERCPPCSPSVHTRAADRDSKSGEAREKPSGTPDDGERVAGPSGVREREQPQDGAAD